MTTVHPSADATAAALVAWRLDADKHAAGWDSGLGAERAGGRWNPKGVKAVYCSFDPSTTLLESAVHRGFMVLDMQPFTLTGAAVTDMDGRYALLSQTRRVLDTRLHPP